MKQQLRITTITTSSSRAVHLIYACGGNASKSRLREQEGRKGNASETCSSQTSLGRSAAITPPHWQTSMRNVVVSCLPYISREGEIATSRAPLRRPRVEVSSRRLVAVSSSTRHTSHLQRPTFTTRCRSQAKLRSSLHTEAPPSSLLASIPWLQHSPPSPELTDPLRSARHQRHIRTSYSRPLPTHVLAQPPETLAVALAHDH
jgi:hypothetical protein